MTLANRSALRVACSISFDESFSPSTKPNSIGDDEFWADEKTGIGMLMVDLEATAR